MDDEQRMDFGQGCGRRSLHRECRTQGQGKQQAGKVQERQQRHAGEAKQHGQVPCWCLQGVAHHGSLCSSVDEPV
jgi:hypothetical protein